MITSLIYLLIYLLIIGLVVWLALYVINAVPLPEPFHTVARVVIVVIGCLALILVLLNFIGVYPEGRPLLR
jgi:hypothetical protein